MKRRLTQADGDRIRAEYTKWEQNKFAAGHETIDELCARVGISRSRLYDLRNNDWIVSTRGHHSTGSDTETLAPVVRYLTEELVAARARIDELEAKLAARARRRGA